MEIITRLNAVIDHIEENLTNEIDWKELSRIAYCSEHHFKRMFSFIAGIPLSEYIRRRRLTLAALELRNSNARIIDIAQKYGYQSADSFSRAFQSMHGVSPSAVKQNQTGLRAYPRMNFHITIKGGSEMRYRLVEKPAFHFMGVKDVVQHSVGDFPTRLWEELDDQFYTRLKQLADTELDGILHVTANITDDKLDYYIGVATTKENSAELVKLTIPASTWAVFDVEGDDPEATMHMWERVYTEWFPTTDFELGQAPEMIRTMDGMERNELWVPVVAKDGQN